MDTNDIELNASPTEKRCTAHIFCLPFWISAPDSLQMLQVNGPLTFSLTSAVLYHFATQKVKDVLSDSWEKFFYPEGITTATIKRQRDEAEEKRKKQAEKRDERDENPQGWQAKYAGMLMMLPYVMVPRDQLMAVCREAEEKRAERKQRRVERRKYLPLASNTPRLGFCISCDVVAIDHSGDERWMSRDELMAHNGPYK